MSKELDVNTDFMDDHHLPNYEIYDVGHTFYGSSLSPRIESIDVKQGHSVTFSLTLTSKKF